MIGERRRREIVARVQKVGYVEARTLAKDLGVDVSTIRRDLDALGQAGLVQRTHGGALILGEATVDMPYEAKRLERQAQKRSIAEYGARLVRNGESVILDSGSTTYALAEALRARDQLTVATNDLRIAYYCAGRGGFRLLVCGGQLIDSVFTLVGAATLSFFGGLHVDWAFLGADALDAVRGVSNFNTVEVPVKQAMIAAADRTVLLADSSKFGRRALAPVVGIDAFEVIVSDEALAPAERAAYGPRLVCVPASNRTSRRKAMSSA